MSASTPEPPSWPQFTAMVAELSGVDREQVQRETLPIEELGFDSLQLAEIVVVLIDDYGVESLAQDLDTRAWEKVTLGQLFDEIQQGPRSAG
jgi:acyl carrier protein